MIGAEDRAIAGGERRDLGLRLGLRGRWYFSRRSSGIVLEGTRTLSALRQYLRRQEECVWPDHDPDDVEERKGSPESVVNSREATRVFERVRGG